MTIVKDIKKARLLLEKSENITYFFDSDCDGTCSFLQLYKKYGGKGYIVKDSKSVIKKYYSRVIQNNTDLVVILDLPEIDEEFNQETEEELLDIPTFLRRQAN